MYCENCGNANRNGAKFCTRCGSPLNPATHEAGGRTAPGHAGKKFFAWFFALVAIVLVFAVVYLLTFRGTGEAIGKHNEQSSNLTSYRTGIIHVEPHATIQETMYEYYPDMREAEEAFGLGGAKLIGEMSVDKCSSLPDKSAFDEGTDFTVKPLEELQLIYVATRTEPALPPSHTDQPVESNIVTRIFRREVTVTTQPVGSSSFGSMYMDISITNITSSQIVCVIPLGQMIEVAGHGVQNVTVSRACTFTLEPNETRTERLSLYCASQYRTSPSGYNTRLTPFILDIPASAFESQNALWNYQKKSIH